MYILNALPDLTAVMQETVCSTKQKISANPLLTIHECMKLCEMPFTAGTNKKVFIKQAYKFIIKLLDLTRKGLRSDMTLKYAVYLVLRFKVKIKRLFKLHLLLRASVKINDNFMCV